jgi:asparagine synthase (glutamine-hydrolysing)
MCGLAGFAGIGDQEDIAAMTRALSHRGPDGEGLYADPCHPIFLGHRRLAIIDIAGGAQPMWNEDESIAVVFNGEIYNHRELRKLLESNGHRFRTAHSDTEVLLHGYEQWGTGLPQRLNGMFAFALWDRPRRTFFLARDRFGEKPLYWSRDRDLFLFASEMSALAKHRHFRPEVDAKSLAKLLGYGFLPSPNAFWRRTQKLPSGSWLRFELDRQAIEIVNYWRFRIEPGDAVPVQAAADELRVLLRTSVARRMMSEVPLGIFLSGGIDSSAVASAAVEANKPASVASFAIGFTEPSYDESKYARRVADWIGTQHHEEVLTIDAARDLIPQVLSHLDEPLADASLLPSCLLSRFASRHITVALSGDGGDELFAGYDTFAAIDLARLYRALVPPRLHTGFCRLADILPLSTDNMSFDFKLRRALAGLGRPAEFWHPLWLAPLPPDAIGDLMNERVEIDDLYSEALNIWNGSSSPELADRAMEFYASLYLPDNILAKVDRASMMYGLETRAAFLDNELVDFVRRLPSSLKLKGRIRKYVLKKALAGAVPKDILARPKKGFGVPLIEWLRRLPYPGDQGFGLTLDFNAVHRWHAEHRSGRADHRLFLWAWLVLQHHQVTPRTNGRAGDGLTGPRMS